MRVSWKRRIRWEKTNNAIVFQPPTQSLIVGYQLLQLLILNTRNCIAPSLRRKNVKLKSPPVSSLIYSEETRAECPEKWFIVTEMFFILINHHSPPLSSYEVNVQKCIIRSYSPVVTTSCINISRPTDRPPLLCLLCHHPMSHRQTLMLHHFTSQTISNRSMPCFPRAIDGHWSWHIALHDDDDDTPGLDLNHYSNGHHYPHGTG